LFDKLHALVLDELRVFLEAAINRKADLPRPRVELWIFDRRFVADRVWTDQCVALDDVQLLGLIIAGAIEPRLSVEARHVDDQRVALPLAARPSHPGVDRALAGAVHPHDTA